MGGINRKVGFVSTMTFACCEDEDIKIGNTRATRWQHRPRLFFACRSEEGGMTAVSGGGNRRAPKLDENTDTRRRRHIQANSSVTEGSD